MTVLSVAYNVISPIFIIVLLSALTTRYFPLEPRTVSTMIVYLFSPLLVLGSMANTTLLPEELVQIFGVMLGLTVMMSALGFGLARLLGYDRRLESAFVMTIVLINAGNYGIPLNEFAFGRPGMERAIVYYVASAVIANTYGVFLASRGTASARQALLNVFKLPMVYCLVIGLALNFTGTKLPLPLQRVTDLLGSAAVPGMLVLLGMQLARASLRGQIRPILFSAGMRLVISPLVAAGLALALGISGLTRDVVIVESAMPTAVMTSALAIQFDADGDFVAASILLSTVASIATLSLLLALLGVS